MREEGVCKRKTHSRARKVQSNDRVFFFLFVFWYDHLCEVIRKTQDEIRGLSLFSNSVTLLVKRRNERAFLRAAVCLTQEPRVKLDAPFGGGVKHR